MRISKTLSLIILLVVAVGCEKDSSFASPESTTGQGGSMTRFAISGNYMYIVDHSAIKVLNIAAGSFQLQQEVSVGSGMETIFAMGDYLYLGAVDAMYIYSIADRQNPTFVFRYQHIVACDPVVVQGNRAYVTMRGGATCRNAGANALEIIDISNPFEPKLITNYALSSPYGLGVENTLLFVCEGENGFKVLDITDERNVTVAVSRDDFFAYDVIARQGVATITGEDGIFQFSYGDGTDLTLISKIPVLRAEL